MRRWICSFVLPIILVSLCLFGCPTSTPTSDEEARGVCYFMQTFASDALVAGRTYEAAQPQYQSLDPALVASISQFNQALLTVETQGANGQSISPQTVFSDFTTQLSGPNGIISLLTLWGTAPISGATGPTQAQDVLLGFLALEAAENTVVMIYNDVSGNLPTWAQLQAQNATLQVQLNGAAPTSKTLSPLYLKLKALKMKK